MNPSISAARARANVLSRRAGWVAGALIALSSFALPAFSHHSDAAFDTETVIALRGTVEQFAWRNPHVYIRLSAQEAAGATTTWEVEAGSTPVLLRRGWTAESLKPGDAVTVRAHPSRDGQRNYGMLVTVQKSDGSVLGQSPAESAVATASSLAGIWRGREEALGPIYEQLGGLQLTSKGQAEFASYDPARDDPALQCIAPPTPATLIATVIYLTEIELLEDRILFRSEFFDAERTIWMDGRGHPENGARTIQGHSIGHWEGDTLVVDTTLFADNRSALGDGVASGAQHHVVERFRLSDDRTRLLIDFLVEDPEYLVEPFAASMEWDYAPQFTVYRYNCDPEVSRHYYTLQ